MKKRLLSLLMALVMVFSLLPLESFAAETEENTAAQATITEDVSVELDAVSEEPAEPTPEPTEAPAATPETAESETAKPSEEPAAPLAAAEQSGDFTYTVNDAGEATITGYTGSAAEHVTIPAALDDHPVTAIGGNAFKALTGLKSVVIADTVTSIGANAFSQCPNLQSVVFSDNITSIGNDGFSGCPKLAITRLPGNLKSLGQAAFANCTSITAIEIPASLTSCGFNNFSTAPFGGCSNLKQVTFEAGTTAVAANLMRKCDGIEEIAIPDTVTSIGANAFSECPNLRSVVFSDSITSIGNDGFSGCPKLAITRLPGNLKSLGQAAFANCTSITAIEIPASLTSCGFNNFSTAPFGGCTNLKQVTFEAGTTAVAANLMRKCDGIEEIAIPDTVTSIGANAFSQCPNLRSVVFSDSITSIGNDGFSGCPKLAITRLPGNLKSLGQAAFANCTSITAIEIPASLTSCGFNNFSTAPFGGCSNLKQVTFEAGTTAVAANLMRKCDGIEEIAIPDTVTSIGANAFSQCANLRYIDLPSSVAGIGNDAFSGSGVTICCSDLSYAATYAIEHNFSFRVVSPFRDANEYVLDRNGTSFFASLNTITVNGCISLTVSYALKDNWANKASNKKVKLFLPSNVELNDESLRLNDAVPTSFTHKGRTVEIPVSEPAGTIRMTVQLMQQGPLLGYASLTGKADGKTFSEVIGLLNETVSLLSMNAPDMTGKETITVTGLAPKSGMVTISVDGETAATVTASKTGSWSAEITLPNPTDFRSYTITASCETEDKTLTQSARVLYHVGEPDLTGFEMYYQEHKEHKSVDLLELNGVKPKVWFLPGTQFDFVLKYTNPETIDKLYITSTRNNEKKYLEAEYDAARGAFVTNGFFDETNHSYVPGTIGIEYIKKTEPVKVGQDMDLSSFEQQAANLPENAYTVVESSDTDRTLLINLSSYIPDLKDVVLDTSVSVFDASTGMDLGTWQGFADDAETVLSYLIPGVDDEKYIVNLDCSDPYTWIMVVKDITGSEAVKFILKTAMEDPAISTGTYQTLSTVATAASAYTTVAGIMLKQHQISEDMDELRGEVMTSPYVTDREQALKQVDALEHDEQMFYLITALMPVMLVMAPIAITGAAMTAPVIAFTALLALITATAPIFWEMRTAQAKGQKARIGFMIDPSGYVYDLETEERLKDVTVTAYWIEYDESEDFWTTIPADDEYGTLWNALEYEQANPLQTNEDGKYAWDVPEGWWRVKYEKDGYETTWSEWMTVPPIQTEVNIGMQKIPDPPKDGWQQEDGSWYYYKDGAAVTGWEKVNNVWYWFNADGVMQTGWQKISNVWYYFAPGGAMVTGWQVINKTWYHFTPGGAMQTGWQKISNVWYYFASSGAMQTGWQTIGGKTYYLKPSGAMAANEWCGGWWLNADGSWTYPYKGSWKQDAKGWWFGDTSGWYAKNTKVRINDRVYSFDARGYML